MDIRARGKDFRALSNLREKYGYVFDTHSVSLTEDSNAQLPIIMVKDSDGALTEWTRGLSNVTSFIKYGYVRIRKSCPYQLGKCRAEKCQLYVIRNGTGDCAHVWSAMMEIEK